MRCRPGFHQSDLYLCAVQKKINRHSRITIGPLNLRSLHLDNQNTTDSYFLAVADNLEVGRMEYAFSHRPPSSSVANPSPPMHFVKARWLRHPDRGTFTQDSNLPIVLMDDSKGHTKNDADTGDDQFTSSVWPAVAIRPAPVSGRSRAFHFLQGRRWGGREVGGRLGRWLGGWMRRAGCVCGDRCAAGIERACVDGGVGEVTAVIRMCSRV